MGPPGQNGLMHFTRVAPNSHYRSLRLLSREGNWELGLSPFSQLTRLRMGVVGRPPGVMDFCLGKNPALISEVFCIVVLLLETLPEEIGPAEIGQAFPWRNGRPDLAIHLVPLREAARVSASANTRAVGVHRAFLSRMGKG